MRDGLLTLVKGGYSRLAVTFNHCVGCSFDRVQHVGVVLKLLPIAGVAHFRVVGPDPLCCFLGNFSR